MRRKTDNDCPQPTLDEMRGEGLGVIWTLAIVMVLLLVGALWSVARAAESNVYWRVDLNQGTSIIAYGQGSTEDAAWQDCFRLRLITRAMTVAETRKSAVSAITSPAVRWCKNPMQLATVTPDPVPINCVVSAYGAWTGGAWSTCVNGAQTRQETRARTITTQPANGGAACPVLTETRTATQPCTTAPRGAAQLSWTPPTQNTDGSSLTNLAGYRIVYGASPTELTQVVQIANAGVTRHEITGLAAGTYHFAVKAYTSQGTESAHSNVTQKVIL